MSVETESLPHRAGLWHAAQVLGLALTIALLLGLWSRPDSALKVLWYAVIPVLPAVFLVHPGLWRNVCPLATLNMISGKWSRGWTLDAGKAKWATVMGIALLALLVPARRVVFNTDGPALAAVIVAVALLALVLGFLFDRKAGFCNAICPVLPVERLYGQNPLGSVSNPRCPSCTLCTARGCLDLAPRRSASQAVRGAERWWTLTSYGAFAAAFPGFVVAYYLVPDGGWVDVPAVYATVAVGSAVSWAAVSVLLALLGTESRRALPFLGATALGLYYWFGAPGIAEVWGVGDAFATITRVAALGLIAFWLWRHRIAARAPSPG